MTDAPIDPTRKIDWQARAKRSGLSQKLLAEILGVAENTVSLQLRGKWASGTPQYVKSMVVAWEQLSLEAKDRLLTQIRTEDSPSEKATRTTNSIDPWLPVEKLFDMLANGEQLDVLFGSPGWATSIVGVVTRLDDELSWMMYLQDRDRFEDWDAEAPKLFMLRPELPEREEG